MNALMQRCMSLVLVPGVHVKEWSDGSFSVQLEGEYAGWQVDYEHDNGWISLGAPLAGVSSFDAVSLKRLLHSNIDLLAIRFAVWDNMIGIRVEVSEAEFSVEEFRFISNLMVAGLKRAVQEFGLASPPEHDP